MKEETTSYKQIFRATSIFGGVQVFNIIIRIIRGKFVAILLGPMGIGLVGLLSSTIGLVSTITSLGIGFSAIRDISEANETKNTIIISKSITVLRKWVWFTGLLGTIATLILSPLLSEWTFGNRDYTWSFMWLSITMLLGAINSGQNALLQGMRKLKDMAKSTMIGSACGLISSLPLYYFYGIQGVVPALIVASAVSLILSWYFARKIEITKTTINFADSFSSGLGMAKLGIFMTISGFISSLVSYFVNSYISHSGGIEEVGLYLGGWAITTQYVGMVFTAMGTDYYPRLSAINDDNLKVKNLVNQQAEIAILIVVPILVLLLTTIPLVINILYTEKFLKIINMVNWSVLGMIFKTSSWSIGFIILAKGESRLFFITELITNFIMLSGSIGGYYFYGIEGIGISFLISYIIHFFMMFFIARKRYEFTFEKEFIKILMIQLQICVIAFLVAHFMGFPWMYTIGSLLFICSASYSLFEMNKRVNLKKYLAKKQTP